MTLTPAIKGQLTKAIKAGSQPNTIPNAVYLLVRQVFLKHMPAQQAKHATRKYLRPRSAVSLAR